MSSARIVKRNKVKARYSKFCDSWKMERPGLPVPHIDDWKRWEASVIKRAQEEKLKKEQALEESQTIVDLRWDDDE